MPHVQPGSRVVRQGQKSRDDIARDMPEAMPRDALRTAFAGDKNRGPAGKASEAGHTTHQKSRRLRRAEGKQPVR